MIVRVRRLLVVDAAVDGFSEPTDCDDGDGFMLCIFR
jgi:hypothetical protein